MQLAALIFNVLNILATLGYIVSLVIAVHLRKKDNGGYKYVRRAQFLAFAAFYLIMASLLFSVVAELAWLISFMRFTTVLIATQMIIYVDEAQSKWPKLSNSDKNALDYQQKIIDELNMTYGDWRS